MSDYNKLRKKWYAILKKSGFNDIESSNGMLVHNKQAPRTDSGSKLCQPLTYDSTIEYYSRASEYLHHGTFESDTDKSIWELHCDGYSLRETSKALKMSLNRVFLAMNYLKKRSSQYWIESEPERRREDYYLITTSKH